MRQDPFRVLKERMDRLFEDTFARTQGDDILQGQWLPAVDIRETENEILVEAELPGVDRKDVKVSVENGVLTLSGERQFSSETKQENYHRIERSYGSFMRSFTLPSTVNVDKVEATHKNGVLTVRLPKREEAKPRTVNVKVD
jgi:HSP20 family protein